MEFDLNRVLDVLPVMVWTALPDGHVDFVNRRWSEHTGLSLDEASGCEWQAVVEPSDLPQLLERWRSILASGQPGEMEARVRRFDGQYRWFLVKCSPMRDAAGGTIKWCGVCTDVEDFRRAERTRRRREFDFQSVVDNIPVPVAVTTPSGEVEGLNQRILDYFGKTFEELKGWKASDVVHPDDLDHTIAAQMDAHQRGETYNVESRHLRADGVYRWHNVLGLPLRDPQGNILRWFHLLTDIEDRKRADEALNASEAYSRQMVDSMPGMVAVFTPDGQVERVNRQILEYFGTPEEEHKCWAANDSVLPEDLPRAIEVFSKSLATGEAFEVEVRARRFDGSYRWLQSRGLPLRDADGRIVRWYNLLTDIDERKRAEKALAASERNLRVMIDTVPAYSWSADTESRTEFVSRHYLDYIGLPADRAQDWRWAESVHPDDLTGLTAWWQNILASGKSGEAEARVRRFDGAYRWFLIRVKPLSDERGNIVKWYGVDTDIDDRKRADEALRASERQSRLIVNTIPGMVAVFTASGEAEYLNEQFLEYLGRTFEEFANWPTNGMVHPDDLPRHVEALTLSLKSGSLIDFETRLRRFDGVYRWFQLRGHPARDTDGRIVRWYCLMTDVDDRKRAKEAQVESERNLKVIVDTIPALAWSARIDGTAEFFNQHYLDYIGLSAEQAHGWGWTTMVHPEDLNGLAATWQTILASERKGEAEARLRRHDGEYRWFLFRANPLRDQSGNIVKWYGVNTDIEDRKRAEEALRESERYSRLIVDSIPATISAHTPEGEIEFVNHQLVEYFGKTLEEIKHWKTDEVTHPEDIERTVELFSRSIATGAPFDFEVRARRFDGVYRWLQTRGLPLRDADGRIIRWYNLLIDIDERKRAEEALRASERNLNEIINTIPASAWSARPDGTAEFFNQHYLDYVGLTAEQAQDWGWTVVVHPDDLAGLTVIWQTIMASGKAGETEARLRRADGEYRWLLFRVNPLRDESGTIVKWYGVNTDIEDRKRSEESFRAIVETSPECVQVIAREGTVLRMNAAGAAMAGFASADIVVGRSFFDFVASEHRTQYREFHESVCAGQKGFLEFDLISGQGLRRHMETHAAPMRGGDGAVVQLGVTRDITARKQAEEKLRRSEAFLAEGQHLARMGNLSWNVTSGEIIWSEQLYRIFGFEPGTVVTLDKIAARVYLEDMPLMTDMMERAQRGESDFEYQHRIVLPDQSVKHLHLIAHRARDRTDQIEYMGSVIDITQRRLSEEAIEKLRSEFAQVTRIMSLGALTASIAHEVNQPLAGIITNAGTCLRMLAADPPNIAVAQETARRTIRDGNRAADVIARLRALFRKRTITIEPLDLNEAVREVVTLAGSDLQRSRVVLRTQLADGIPIVGGDQIQIQQVIMNLLRNASDAMSSVNDRPRRLLIRTESDEDNHVRLSVQDVGIGFGPEAAGRLFEAFYTTKSDGMGIGLSVSRSIIESHGGRLWARANDGPGATFSFLIPEFRGHDLPVPETAAIQLPGVGSAHNSAEVGQEPEIAPPGHRARSRRAVTVMGPQMLFDSVPAKR
ncbi:PAS domain-containing sensor histidine kinase [Bradyrhizobium sp. Arg314]